MAFSASTIAHLLLALAAFACLTTTVHGAPNTNLTSLLCNSQTYTFGDPFRYSLKYVLDDLRSSAPSAPSREYRNISPFPYAFAYGRATCSSQINTADCSQCIDAAVDRVVAGCSMRIGGRCLLQDCSVRYEQYPFSD